MRPKSRPAAGVMAGCVVISDDIQLLCGCLSRVRSGVGVEGLWRVGLVGVGLR